MKLTDRINRIQVSPTSAVITAADQLKAKGVDIADFGPGEPYSYLSSKLVREIAQHGGPLSDLVPPTVEQRLRAKVL